MITMMVFFQDDDGHENRMAMAVASTLQEAYESIRNAEEFGETTEMDETADALMQFISTLPSDCRTSFHLLDVLEMFQVETKNAVDFSKSPHRVEALISEVRRRNRKDSTSA